jgi:glycosyltransferase involved in cell wall biosynthesis
MRSGFLTYGLDRPLRGISRSALEVGAALFRRSDCDPIFLTPYSHGPFAGAPYKHHTLPGARLLPALMTLGALEIPLIARRHHLDLVHDPTGVSPFVVGRKAGSFKRVLTLHDTIPHRDPQGSPLLNTFVHRWYIPATLRNVDAVITDSVASRLDLVHYLGLPDHKVHVVPLAADSGFRPVPQEEAIGVAEQYGLRPPYVLFVGAFEPRKNVPTLLRAQAGVEDW